MTSWIEQRSVYDAEAIAAREAEITGQPQRIEALREDEMSDEGRELVPRIRASTGGNGGGPIPEYFLTMVKHPSIFRCQLEMGTAIFKGALPPRERELAVLRIGWLMRAPYEWGEHVDI